MFAPILTMSRFQARLVHLLKVTKLVSGGGLFGLQNLYPFPHNMPVSPMQWWGAKQDYDSRELSKIIFKRRRKLKKNCKDHLDHNSVSPVPLISLPIPSLLHSPPNLPFYLLGISFCLLMVRPLSDSMIFLNDSCMSINSHLPVEPMYYLAACTPILGLSA